MDSEKVIKGLECYLAMRRGEKILCGMEHCPYWEEDDDTGMSLCNTYQIESDALALLKAQEQNPISASIVDSDGGLMHWWACGNCQAPINPEDRFCHECGRVVKWE